MVDAQVEAYRARDVERFLACYADDASVVLFDGSMMFPTKEGHARSVRQALRCQPRPGGYDREPVPTEMVALCAYQVAGGKISKLMLLR